MTSMSISSTVKSLAEAAFSKSKATASPSQVASADGTKPASVAVDKDQELDPTSDAALSLSSSFPSFASFKDQRTFEHDRQRTKHSEDYTRIRGAKAAKATSWLSVREKRDAGANSLTRRERRIGSGAADEEVDIHDALEGVRGAIVRTSAATPKSEVKLSDLIKPSSIRKSRKNKDTDFEVVPALRSVIVLDELAFMHDTPAPRDLEQEWEHVYHSDGDDSDSSATVSTPTYANVLVGGLN